MKQIITISQKHGRIIIKDTKELNTLLRHIGWALNHQKALCNYNDFIKLLETVMTTYQPYFDNVNDDQQLWNLIGCQIEVAENALASISKTLEDRGIKNVFWNTYKKCFM